MRPDTGKVGPVDKGCEEQLGQIDLNCRSLTRMIQLCLPYMGRGSRILNVASAAAFCPQPGFAVYAATKAYVYSLSLALGEELKEQGILVTVLCPGTGGHRVFQPVRSTSRKAAGSSKSHCLSGGKTGAS